MYFINKLCVLVWYSDGFLWNLNLNFSCCKRFNPTSEIFSIPKFTCFSPSFRCSEYQKFVLHYSFKRTNKISKSIWVHGDREQVPKWYENDKKEGKILSGGISREQTSVVKGPSSFFRKLFRNLPCVAFLETKWRK